MLGWNEIESRAIAFQKYWKNTTGDERQDGQTFEKDFMNVFGVDFKDGFHEYQVILNDGSIRYIDYFIPGKILIEMKSKGRSLAKAYSQAMSYVHALKPEEYPTLLMVCDFDKIDVYNLKKDHKYKTFKVSKLKSHVRLFGIIAGYGADSEIKTEIELNTDASYKMAKLHDALKENGYDGHELEVYLVRLLFCLFADDTGIFERESFENYIKSSLEDGSDLSMKLMMLFSILDTPQEKRMKNLTEDLKKFRYINGGLFSENLSPAFFDHKMRNLLIECCKFNWSEISPSIFGAMFQGVMNQKTRRELGAHYTSEENIMKVIGPLFLDDLYDEFEKSKNTKKELTEFHNKIASLKFLDPACGSGNFLILAYQKIRELEFEILKYLYSGGVEEQLVMTEVLYTKVNINQFYGIECDEFPCEVAKLSLLLMKHLMDQEVSNYFGINIVDFPIRDNPNIVHGNSLRIDWNNVVPINELSYVLGNPPFVGARLMNDDQKQDMKLIFGKIKGIGNLDYVTAWYYKAANMTTINKFLKIAFVSTNSIVQGEQVAILWKPIMEKFNCDIKFSYTTFRWGNKAKYNAAVHCVIIAFSNANQIYKNKRIIKEDGTIKLVNNINGYLIDAPNIFIESRRKPISNITPMSFGSMPNDGGNLILNTEEKEEIIKKYPFVEPYIKPFVGASEFINNKKRWCIWLKSKDLLTISKSKMIMDRIENVRNHRLKSGRQSTKDLALQPYAFGENRQPDTKYLLFPGVSSEKRRYIPIGYMENDIIASNATLIVADSKIFMFAILSSNVHMAWVRAISGRLKSDYRYSASVVYNNFVWPEMNDEMHAKLEKTGMKILNIREKYNEWTLADLYNPLLMPPDLQKAHQANDRAVWEVYGKKWNISSEEECVAYLMKLYKEKTEKV